MVEMVIDCGCGQRLAVPEALVGKSIRCPKCKQVVKAIKKSPVARPRQAAPTAAAPSPLGNPPAPSKSSNPARPQPMPRNQAVATRQQVAASPSGSAASPQTKIQAIGFVVTFIVIGLLGMTFGGYSIAQSLGAGSWEKATGTVLTSKVGSSIQQSTRLKKGSGSSTKQSILVEYEYMVEEQTYTNDRISFAIHSSNNIDTLNEIARRYSNGTTVDVHYKSSNPQVSVLETNVPGLSIVFFLVGLILLIVGACLVPRVIKMVTAA